MSEIIYIDIQAVGLQQGENTNVQVDIELLGHNFTVWVVWIFTSENKTRIKGHVIHRQCDRVLLQQCFVEQLNQSVGCFFLTCGIGGIRVDDELIQNISNLTQNGSQITFNSHQLRQRFSNKRDVERGQRRFDTIDQS